MRSPKMMYRFVRAVLKSFPDWLRATPPPFCFCWHAEIRDLPVRQERFLGQNVASFGDRMANINYVFGAYESRSAVECAVRGFKDAGFSGSQISVILPDKRGSKEIVSENDAKSPQSVTLAPSSGIGGALGWLVGLGEMTLPGLGPVVAVGPLVAALAATGAGGTSGSFAGSLVALGMPQVSATQYEHGLLRGEVLVAIRCQAPEHCQRAREIMEITRAEHIAYAGDIFNEPNSSAA
jgi:hypothetical protein